MAADPNIIDVNEPDFEERVLVASRTTPVMVDFWAEWCPPCRALTPVLERVTAALGGRVILAKVDADENMKLADPRRSGAGTSARRETPPTAAGTMMNENIQRLCLVARNFGPLREQVVFLAGATTALLVIGSSR